MHYVLHSYSPRHTRRVVSTSDLEGIYASLNDAVLTWNDGGEDDVLIVSVDHGFSTVSLRREGTWYWLEASADTDLVEIQLCGQQAFVPAGVVVSRQAGLDALRSVAAGSDLLGEFSWREQ
jgi:hypothetical protein